MPNESDLLTTEQVANLLGFSSVSVRRWRRNKKGPPCRKLGGKVKYLKSDVLEWFKNLPYQ